MRDESSDEHNDESDTNDEESAAGERDTPAESPARETGNGGGSDRGETGTPGARRADRETDARRADRDEDARPTDEGDSRASAIDDIAERLDTLESEVETLRESDTQSVEAAAGERFENVERRLVELRDFQERLRDRIDGLESSFDDYRQRAETERDEIRKYSVESFAREMIDVKDSLSNSREFLELDDEAQRNLDILDRQFEQALNASGVQEIDTDGKLEPGKHRPVEEVEDESREPGEIVDTRRAGYVMHDRVIRPAEVVVVESN